MSGSADFSYYQKNRNVILNRVKDYCENDKERLRRHARNEYRDLSEEEKKENMERKDIVICLKKRNKRLKEYQKKNIVRKESLNIIVNNFLIAI